MTEPTKDERAAAPLDPQNPQTTQLDNEDSAQEPTPIGDAVFAETNGASPSDEDEVKRALKRKTHDGKGDEDPGPSDWISYATEGVEKEND